MVHIILVLRIGASVNSLVWFRRIQSPLRFEAGASINIFSSETAWVYTYILQLMPSFVNKICARENESAAGEPAALCYRN
jgi:hypothetical protein